MRGRRIAHHSAPLGADQSARGRDRAERRSFIRDGAGHCRWKTKMSVRSSPQRLMRPCATRSSISSLYWRCRWSTMAEAMSRATRRKNASPSDRWCSIARAATPSVRSDRRDLTRRGKWARPGLIAVGLRHAHIDRKIRPSREADRVSERDASGPFLFRQAVDAQPSTKTAAFECNDVIPQRRELDLARHDIRFEAKRAAGRVIEPEIDAREVAGRYRGPGERGARVGLVPLALGIEEIPRGEAQEAIAGHRQLPLPHRLAPAAAIFRALP